MPAVGIFASNIYQNGDERVVGNPVLNVKFYRYGDVPDMIAYTKIDGGSFIDLKTLLKFTSNSGLNLIILILKMKILDSELFHPENES
jgi:hypothetical protein